MDRNYNDIPFSGKVWSAIWAKWRRKKRLPGATQDEVAAERNFKALRSLMQERPKPGRAGGAL